MQVKSLVLFAAVALAVFCPDPSDIHGDQIIVDVRTFFKDTGKGPYPRVNATGDLSPGGPWLPNTTVVTLDQNWGWSPTFH